MKDRQCNSSLDLIRKNIKVKTLAARIQKSIYVALPAFLMAGLLLNTASTAVAARGDENATDEKNVITLPELTVSASAEKQKGDLSISPEALPAQVDIIGAEEIDALPANNFLDLLRRSPGVIPRGLLQGDIGEGFSVRGFGGGHGTSNAIFVDGVPLNTPNHAHAHGLTDANCDCVAVFHETRNGSVRFRE